MKPLPFVLLATLGLSLSVHSQDAAAGGSQEPAIAGQTTAQILGTLPDGTPPPPAPPKPEFIIPNKDILRTTFHQQGGRTITMRQIKPIDLPPPVGISTAEPATAFRASVAKYHETHADNALLFMGATIYRSKDSLPRTLVRYWPQRGGASITFWSSADFALIAGGINSFADSVGDTHSIIMTWGNADIEDLSELSASGGIDHVAPEIPALPAGPATFKIIGNPPVAEDLVLIQSLHDLYNSNLAELTTAYQGREQARLAREADLKAHPPQPKDITLNYWRIGGGTSVKGSAQ